VGQRISTDFGLDFLPPSQRLIHISKQSNVKSSRPSHPPPAAVPPPVVPPPAAIDFFLTMGLFCIVFLLFGFSRSFYFSGF
jgi:hypothetical protein